VSSEPSRINFRLYIVTDRHEAVGRDLEEIVAAAARGGAGAIQLREKDLSARDLYALALDAAGVHLAGHSLPTAVARRVLGAGKLLGVSTHSIEEARCAAEDGADFIVFGPVFTTPSKVAYGPPQGLQHLSTVVRAVRVPVIAIGGIDHTNLPQVVQAGAYGVAMIRAVLAAPDPYKATQQLRAALAVAHQV
jgi:thiamine-phosphate pyrophosphorylase